MSVNRVLLLGNLTKDVDVRFMPNGDAVASFSLATNETWKDKQGVKQQKAEYHNIVTYRKLAEICGKYLKKGQQVYIEGKLQTRKWEKDGVTRYSTEIIADTMQMVGGKPDGHPAKENAPKRDNVQTDGGFDDMSDDIPF